MSDIDQLVEVPDRQLHTHSQKGNLYKDGSLQVICCKLPLPAIC